MIEETPTLPTEFKRPIQDKRFAVFLGAGVSRLVGCWSWQKLAHKLVDMCYRNGIIRVKAQDFLKADNDYRRTITICFDLTRQNGKLSKFWETMRNALKGDKRKDKDENILSLIWKLQADLYVTTNADLLFDKYFSRSHILYDSPDFNLTRFDQIKTSTESPYLCKIHGSRNRRSSMIFTLEKYFERYKGLGENKDFPDFLREIFKWYSILFLGYGLNELELLEYLFSKSDEEDTTITKHLLLSPFFSNDTELLDLHSLYYGHMGINVIGYQKDKLGYKQLNNVIKDWADRIRIGTPRLDDRFRMIDEAVR